MNEKGVSAIIGIILLIIIVVLVAGVVYVHISGIVRYGFQDRNTIVIEGVVTDITFKTYNGRLEDQDVILVFDDNQSKTILFNQTSYRLFTLNHWYRVEYQTNSWGDNEIFSITYKQDGGLK